MCKPNESRYFFLLFVAWWFNAHKIIAAKNHRIHCFCLQRFQVQFTIYRLLDWQLMKSICRPFSNWFQNNHFDKSKKVITDENFIEWIDLTQQWFETTRRLILWKSNSKIKSFNDEFSKDLMIFYDDYDDNDDVNLDYMKNLFRWWTCSSMK